MNHTATTAGSSSGLRSKSIRTLFTMLGLVAVAWFAALGVAATSGYNVVGSVTDFFKSQRAAAAVPTAEHNGALTGARVAELPDGRIVVSMDVNGEFKGLMSVWIERGSGGSTITGGDWSIVHAYTEDVLGQAAGTRARRASGEHEEHPDGETFINKGTLGGSITGGTITFNANGSLASLNAIGLSLTSGSLTYTGVQGQGTVQVFNASEQSNSTGTVTLNF